MPQKQTRASVHKVRTGCRTCKARRVKCDEAKPVCLRCSSSGRECEGYGFQPKCYPWLFQKPTTKLSEEGSVHHNTGITLHPVLASLPGINSYERQNFELFRLQTAHELPGLFQSDFWASVLPQASHLEPAVLHASVALGALHRKAVMDSMSIPSQDMTDKVVQFSLAQFIQATSLLRKRLEDPHDPESSPVLLICCILFISIEMLRGHYGTAMLHLHNGRNILYNRFTQSRCVGPDDTLILSSTSHSIEDELVEVFARLDIQSTNFGLRAPRFRLLTENISTDAETGVPESFSSLHEARQHFDSLSNAIHHFLGMSVDPAFHNTANPLAVAQRDDLFVKLQDWSQALEKLRTRLPTSRSEFPVPGNASTTRERKLTTLLRLNYQFLRIRLSVCLSCGVEMTYDRFTDDFSAIISLAEDLIGRGGHLNEATSPLPLPSFSLDIGLVQPVYFTAIKCRIPKLRRRALSVLSSTPHREGMWDATLMATLAARIIELEEAAAGAFALSGPEQEYSLPEPARFCEVRVLIVGEAGAGAALYCKQRHSDILDDVTLRKEYCAFDGGALVRKILSN